MTSIILLVVYLLGVVATIVGMYCDLEKGERVTVNQMLFNLLISSFSWIGFIFFCVVAYGNRVIFTKKVIVMTDKKKLTTISDKTDKECMYAQPNYTNEERLVLCEGCEELCKYNKTKKEIKQFTLINVLSIDINKDLVDDNVKEFANIVKDMTTLYAKKNHNYGNSFEEGCDKIGAGYATGRLLDKLNRIINLTKDNNEAQVDESIEDTLLDLANYSVMYLNYLRKLKNNSYGTNKA